MHNVCFQRLKLDEKSGFNYCYMGYGEYENGATKKARSALARLFMDGELEAFVGEAKPFNQSPIDVYGFCKKGLVVQALNYLTNFRNKGPFVYPDTVAWMGIDAPLLLLRNKEHIPQADLFLKPAIAAIKEERKGLSEISEAIRNA